ncbi:signal transduction histidine kinase [Conyzicola nivalis]|uniref:histidine kinase n=1 Tax=Conyzicola nivalis TaxID=1477021 RepID=A0ABV2QLF7_9MICO
MTVRPSSLDRNDVPVEGDLRLPKPPGMIRQFWYRHPRWTDALIAASYGVPTTLLHIGPLFGEEFSPGEIVPFGFALDVFGALLLLFRRGRPWTVLVVSWVLVLLSAVAWSAVDVGLLAYALYALAVYGSVRAVWIGFAGSVAVVVVAGTYVSAVTVDDYGQTVAGNFAAAVFLVIVVLVAINIGNRRRYVVALLDRAAQLARERDQQARLAAADERARIAREMHDIVSHGLTVMVTLAEGSAATTTANPERAAEAMRHVAETGRQALTDMRRMLGLLDDGLPGELVPQPRIADLAELVERFRSAGLAVSFSQSGTPPDDPAEQLTVYRLVQESLTNVLRHSAIPAVATVSVHYTPTEVTVAVTNDGPVVAVPTPGSGRGTVGMRERVALYGGTIESGPRPGGGWSVVATLEHDTPR